MDVLGAAAQLGVIVADIAKAVKDCAAVPLADELTKPCCVGACVTPGEEKYWSIASVRPLLPLQLCLCCRIRRRSWD